MSFTVDAFPDEAVAAVVAMIALETKCGLRTPLFGWPRLGLIS